MVWIGLLVFSQYTKFMTGGDWLAKAVAYRRTEPSSNEYEGWVKVGKIDAPLVPCVTKTPGEELFCRGHPVLPRARLVGNIAPGPRLSDLLLTRQVFHPTRTRTGTGSETLAQIKRDECRGREYKFRLAEQEATGASRNSCLSSKTWKYSVSGLQGSSNKV